jgi:uncharacterized RDD family membrane protein YckC
MASVAEPAQQQAGWGAAAGPAPGPMPPAPPGWGMPGAGWPVQALAPPDLARVWPRIGARVLDAVLVGIVMAVLSAAVPLPDGAGYTLVLVVVMVGYETLLLAGGGQTLGKMVFGLRVVRADRDPVTARDALVRSALVDAIGMVPLGWPILAIALEQHPVRQGWHDRVAGTLVVTIRRPTHKV